MSKYYVVMVEEIHVSHMVIEADSEDEARGIWTEGDELRLEYSSTYDTFEREVVEFNPLDYSREELSRMHLDERQINELYEKAQKEQSNG